MAITKFGKLVSDRSITFGAHRLPTLRKLHPGARRIAEPWGERRTCKLPLGCGAEYRTRLPKRDQRRNYCESCRRRLTLPRGNLRGVSARRCRGRRL